MSKFRYSGTLDPKRCVASVSNGMPFAHFFQCRFKRKPDSEWCGVHNPDAVKAREKKQEDKWNADRKKREDNQKATEDKHFHRGYAAAREDAAKVARKYKNVTAAVIEKRIRAMRPHDAQDEGREDRGDPNE